MGSVDVVSQGLEVEQAAFLALQVGAVVFQRLLHAVQQFGRQAAMTVCVVAAEGFGKLGIAYRLHKLLHEVRCAFHIPADSPGNAQRQQGGQARVDIETVYRHPGREEARGQQGGGKQQGSKGPVGRGCFHLTEIFCSPQRTYSL